MAKVISIAIQKGGCAKTTTALNIASCLHIQGKKVLVIDFDPQANLSSACKKESVDKTIYELMKSQCSIDEVITSTEEFDLIPSNILLCSAEQEFTNTGREYIIKKIIQPIQDRYDFIIIDCPPSLGILTVNAFTASDFIIIPIEPSYFALRGLGQLSKTINTVQEYCNKKLKLLGIVIVKYSDRTNLNKAVKDDVYEAGRVLNTKVFNAKIREATAVKESQGMQVPLSQYAPNSKAFLDYQELTNEILKGVE